MAAAAPVIPPVKLFPARAGSPYLPDEISLFLNDALRGPLRAEYRRNLEDISTSGAAAVATRRETLTNWVMYSGGVAGLMTGCYFGIVGGAAIGTKIGAAVSWLFGWGAAPTVMAYTGGAGGGLVGAGVGAFAGLSAGETVGRDLASRVIGAAEDDFEFWHASGKVMTAFRECAEMMGDVLRARENLGAVGALRDSRYTLRDFICPITQDLIHDPVSARGHVFERESLLRATQYYPHLHPIDRRPLTREEIKPDRAYHVKVVQEFKHTIRALDGIERVAPELLRAVDKADRIFHQQKEFEVRRRVKELQERREKGELSPSAFSAEIVALTTAHL